MRSTKITLLLICILAVLTACAPDNLDITPSPTTAPTSTPAPTREAGAATEVATEVVETVSESRIILDTIIAAVPTSIGAGNATWRKDDDETTGEDIVYQDQEGGVTAKV